jgi:3',5'-cyclic AMP phosphodiesterase CpdA
MATGTLGPEQLARLPALLDSTAKQGLFRVVYLHHSPVQGQEKWRKRLTDAGAIQALLEAHGAELVVHGHGHRAHFSTLDTRCGSVPVIAQPSSSALGLHGADIALYNQYTVVPEDSGWELAIEGRVYDRDSGACKDGGVNVLHLARNRR